MKSMRLIRIFFLALLVQVSASAQVRPASIEGFVIKAGTGEPISKATVTLTGGSGSVRSAVVTASDGRFMFSKGRLRGALLPVASESIRQVCPFQLSMR